MQFNGQTTGGLFVAIVALGVIGLLTSGVMAVNVILMMVLPAMVVFGAVCLALGVRYGQYRSGG